MGFGRGGSAPLAPAPGLANLDRLIKRTCSAGVRVSLEVYGNARPLPAGLDLSAYRIVQEALTNVVKHAGSGARCTVHLGYDEGVLAIRVTDDGGSSTTLPRYGGPSAGGHQDQAGQAAGDKIPVVVGVNSTADVVPRAEAARSGHGTVGGWRVPGEPPATAGHGIIGMRERAHLCGGKFSAGRWPRADSELAPGPGSRQPRPAHQADLQRGRRGEPRGVRKCPPAAGRP